MDSIAINELRDTGIFSDMKSSTDEDEHSLEMHLPYIRLIFQGWVVFTDCLNYDHLINLQEGWSQACSDPRGTPQCFDQCKAQWSSCQILARWWDLLCDLQRFLPLASHSSCSIHMNRWLMINQGEQILMHSILSKHPAFGQSRASRQIVHFSHSWHSHPASWACQKVFFRQL